MARIGRNCVYVKVELQAEPVGDAWVSDSGIRRRKTGLSWDGKDTTGKSVEDKQIDLIKTALVYNGVSEPDDKARKLGSYLVMLERHRDWGKLVSRSLPGAEAILVADSLAVVQVIECEAPAKVAEIGAGGGLLGIACAIACPSWHITLIESSSRKAAFLVEVAGALDLGNVRVENARAETLDAPGSFDIVLSRAAGKLRDLAPVALDMLSPRGRYIALKASDPSREIADAEPVLAEASGRLVEAVSARYPDSLGVQRRASLVVIEKL